MNKTSTSQKPTLVLLHGWGVNQAVWQATTTAIAKEVKVITLDLPGFGAERQFPQPYQLAQIVDQLAAKIPEKSYVYGWSLGGLIAIALADRHPEKVKQLGLIAATPCFLAQENWPGMAETVLQQFAVALSKNLPQTIERFLAIQALGSHSARTDIKALKQAILAFAQPEPAAVSGALDLLSSIDLRQAFKQLKMPLVGCFGRLDSLVPVAVTEQLRQLQPQMALTTLAHASHAPFISHPEQFITWLNDSILRT
ncbi:pimeloyl-ACP methyl ester esterase BioH [Rheinheimera salexigens]|uniref:Pimeloyl-[acyl-carrier protein] methyl ester esterase n=1 Tax=Rheinheimera salexigens TaxID=1628148 RepID=A0A1E7Q256_9GAMM|nr:pimeloyl-ACP methyl ester esterase BioH [Rheinheimera salexigens]OEY68211.1 pimeloyl-[acyl-carrier protein] methyl ester esterase [Rheinheimera salexigens]